MVEQSVPHREASLSISGPDGRDEPSDLLIHASAVRFSGKGVLLLGPSASGKSDLALRLIDAGGVLIADDQVRLRREGDRLSAGPPERLAGLIELRGIGIMRVPFEEGPLDLAIDLLPAGADLDPLPEPASASWLGVELPKIGLDADRPSAVARIRTVLGRERVF
ncbi:MAG: HPr kinase/phosphatase C-terminal domain-containing protein [Alphaproteobacteria bacterium]|nr:HPr kinase/phosphatase C-terminal domain-containing protein [Alphaproteobacteria bacterium]